MYRAANGSVSIHISAGSHLMTWEGNYTPQEILGGSKRWLKCVGRVVDSWIGSCPAPDGYSWYLRRISAKRGYICVSLCLSNKTENREKEKNEERKGREEHGKVGWHYGTASCAAWDIESCIQTLVWDSAIPSVTQLPTNVPGKTEDDGPKTGSLACMWENCTKFQVPGFSPA